MLEGMEDLALVYRRHARYDEAEELFSRALAGKLKLDEVLGVAVSAVADLAGAEGSSILLIDAGTVWVDDVKLVRGAR